jgi:hypothetical protein
MVRRWSLIGHFLILYYPPQQELPAGYRNALEEDGQLTRHARNCVTAANVVHEMVHGAPAEVLFRLLPHLSDERQEVAGVFMDAIDAAVAAATDQQTTRRLKRAVALLCEHCALPALHAVRPRAASASLLRSVSPPAGRTAGSRIGSVSRERLHSSSIGRRATTVEEMTFDVDAAAVDRVLGGGLAHTQRAHTHISTRSATAAAAPEPSCDDATAGVEPTRQLLQAVGAWDSPTCALSRWLSQHDTPLSPPVKADPLARVPALAQVPSSAAVAAAGTGTR